MAMCTNGSGTNSVKPPVSCCSARVRTRWRATCSGRSTCPNMMVTFERRPTECAVRWASSHSSVSILSGQMTARTSSSRISAAVPGSVARPGLLGEHEVVAQRHAEAARALGDLERGEAVHVDLRRDLLHRARDVEVVVAVEVGMDAALQAHLGGAAVDRLDDAPLDLVEVEEVRVAAQVERQRALGEGAEPALERADVRVVDVAVAHEGDGVADGVERGAGRRPPPTSRKSGPRAPSSVTISSTPTSSPASTPSSTSPTGVRARAVHPGGTRRGQQRGRRDVAARGPRVVAGEAFEVGRAAHREAHVVVQPAVAVAHVLGVHGEARRERLAGGFGGVAQHVERRATAARGSRGRG